MALLRSRTHLLQHTYCKIATLCMLHKNHAGLSLTDRTGGSSATYGTATATYILAES